MLQSELLQEIAGLQHGFGTKSDSCVDPATATGPVISNEGGSCHGGDLASAGRPAKGGRPAARHPRATRPLVDVWLPKQVHGDAICDLDSYSELPPSQTIEADAVVTTHPGLAIGIRTADCVPLLVADKRQTLVAAIHSGWRGTVAKISLKVVQYLQKEKGCHPSDLFVAIGPCIQGSCYEVGEEVTGAKVTSYFDMVAENRRLLCEGAVLPDHIDVLDYCTHCETDLFHSYRRDGEKAGRQISWLALT